MTVEADGQLLSLVWNNLLSNAIKFTDDGGKISVSLKISGPMAIVKVADTGCGIDRETGKHIFEKFYRGILPGLPGATAWDLLWCAGWLRS